MQTSPFLCGVFDDSCKQKGEKAKMDNSKSDKTSEKLPPPPPPAVPPKCVPEKATASQRVPMTRRGFGSRGQSISLLTNHFKVTVSKTDGHFYHYSVSIKYEDDSIVDAKGIGRKILDQVYETYKTELASKRFAYDGEKSLFTVGPLPQNKLEFTVILADAGVGNGSPGPDGSPGESDRKRSRKQAHSKTYKVAINFAARIPMQAIANALRGQDSENFQEAVRVLDIMLRQNAAQKGCLLVRQSFFHNEPRNFVDLGGGVVGCRGFHSSFRATQGGLSLNMDVSTTMIVKPGPVIDFLMMNQKVDNPGRIDWAKAKRMLKNLRIKATNTNMEYKISGLSDLRCKEQLFSLKQGRGGSIEAQELNVTVYDYFVHHRNIQLKYSGDYPCINTGKPKRPVYIPIELCSLVSLQRYTKALSSLQRASLVEKSRQKPPERMNALKQALSSSDYAADPLLVASGISISTDFTRIQGRILAAPKLRVGNGQDFVPRSGRWNFNQKRLIEPVKLERWAVVSFSARCDMKKLCDDMIRCGQMKGIFINPPFEVLQERKEFRNNPAPIRVDKMFEMIKSRLPGTPQFILCILSERKNSDVYGPWKRRNLSEFGIVTQCIAPSRVNDQYLTNVLLKINAKEKQLGGLNSLLTIEHSPSIPLVSQVPTLIVGMDVSHGSPGRSDVPSVAAVVSSRQWPLISRYRAAVRTQSPKLEMIDSLFKKVSDEEDQGIFREALRDFYRSSRGRKPDQIIIFRDGVSESQFNQVLNIELEQIIESCKFLDEKWSPKFMVVVAQKNHHTKFFQANSPDNVPPGTVIDNGICSPRTNDFYMCAHAGMIGTTRPTHYHVLFDEIGFSADEMQELVHSLSYVYQRSTTAISIVAPICYAHLAAAQMSQFIKFDELSERSPSHHSGSGSTSSGGISVPALPVLHENITNTISRTKVPPIDGETAGVECNKCMSAERRVAEECRQQRPVWVSTAPMGRFVPTRYIRHVHTRCRAEHMLPNHITQQAVEQSRLPR
ncbi:protein argonaute 4a [Phtheirospermum japonicum]|uniref:Protein argonaute 4a n=2 Tax=Magnoliopsida TaxID=3398 RepID=A0A830BK79_9LAMI|nr:protein argonaute 4a [Phtheirospermum japonicum]